MAHHVEPMDIDGSVCDFDDKENSFHHNNVLPRTPCTEKGYEELDVSELNMKLRYSITPTASPMSKSYTANCIDSRNCDTENSAIDYENGNMTRSLHSTLTKNDTIVKSQKVLPLQALPTDHGQIIDGNRNALRPIDSTVTLDNNIAVTISGSNDMDENMSLPSSSSSIAHTPEATTPTKDMAKGEEGSPIIRGLKSVLNMFRPSQSPIPPAEDEISAAKHEAVSPPIVHSPETSDQAQTVSASTPLAGKKTRDPLAKRNSPNRDSIVFNDDLEKELNWQEETTIIFSKEKIPIHKLFFQQSKSESKTNMTNIIGSGKTNDSNLDATVEYMEVSYNDSGILDKTATKATVDMPNKSDVITTESDGEFVDCESTFTKNQSQLEQSFKSQEDDDLISNGMSAEPSIPQSIEPPSLNATIETVSADLSAASIETAKPENISSEVLQSPLETEATKNEIETQPNTVCEAQKTTYFEQILSTEKISRSVPETVNSVELNQSISVFNDNVKVEQNQIQVVEHEPNVNLVMKPSLAIENNGANVTNDNINVINSSIVENVVISSLSQIPLIADPRVLLFNIPPVVDKEKENEKVTDDVLNTSPADIPLPDDDDIERMSSLPTITENVSLTNKTEDINVNQLTDANAKQEIVGSAVVDQEAKKQEDLILENITVIDKSNSIIQEVDKKETSKDITTENQNKHIMEEIIPVSENMEKATLMNTDPIDISMTEAQGTSEFNVTDLIKGDKVNVKSCIPEVEAISRSMMPDLIKVEESICLHTDDNQGEHSLQLKEDMLETTITPLSILPENLLSNLDSTEIPDCTVSENIKENLKNIKQELEAIVEEAIDIFIDKTTASNSEDDSIFPQVQEVNEVNISSERQSPEILNSTEIKVAEPKELLPEIIKDVLVEKQQSHCLLAEPSCALDITNASTAIPATEDINENANKVQSDVKVDNHLASFINQSNDHQEAGDIYKKISTTLSKIHDITEPTFTIAEDKKVTAKEVLENQSTNFEHPEVNATQIIQQPDLNTTQIVAEIDKLLSDTAMKEDNIMNLYQEKNTGLEDKIESADEELVVSESNSPFVVVSAETQIKDEMKTEENFEEIDNPFAPKSKISITPPLSPKIESKGYNINFDEIEDPFATKVKIRASPTPGASPNQSLEQINTLPELPKRDITKINRRKSQPEKKKPSSNNKKLNSTFAGSSKVDAKVTNKEAKKKQTRHFKVENTESEQQAIDKDPISNASEDKMPIMKETNITNNATKEANIISTINNLGKTNDTGEMLKSEDKMLSEPTIAVANENKQTSSSEHSTYYSAGASSSEGTEPKNSFNIPEIDDPNFNPFASKSKIRQSPPPGDIDPFATKSKIRKSPPPSVDIADPFITKSTMRNSIERSVATDQNSTMCIESPKEIIPESRMKEESVAVMQEEKDSSSNISNITASSKTDKVNTEDEDTVEGPFLEAEDLNNDDRMSDFDSDNVDMMQFSELPPGNEENPEAGELFIDAEAFEFLLNQNKANTISDSGKESLFLKFDPLFAKRVSSDSVMAALKNVQKRQSTPKKVVPPQTDVTFEKSPVAGPSTLNATHDLDMNSTAEVSCDDLNITVSKPMMVVNPAVNPVVTTRNKSITPVRTNRQSLTFTSPAIAVIDRLLSMSANNSYVAHDATIAEVHRDNEADLALTQLRELLADKEISVYNLRSESKELKDRLSNLESQMKSLESISEERLKKINELTEKLNEKTKINKSMAKVVEEYERTIASLIAETEQDKKRHIEERIQLIKERDEQTAHLASMEVSFSDLHSKYEKSKQVILGFKANEDSYKKSIKDFEENLAKMQNNYELLKQHATSKLNHANEELQKINRSHEAEVLKLNAMIKRKELHITSLEETLQQKTKANEELTAICDELINKVG